MLYIEKHVEFNDDPNPSENIKETNHEQQQKLHRRDTPHHLKNKRIISKQNDPIALDVSSLSHDGEKNRTNYREVLMACFFSNS